MSPVISAVFTSTILLCAHASAAGAPSLTQTLPVLAGRWSMGLPPGAHAEVRQRSIMSAPESSEEETRFIYDQGKKRLVIMAYELFAWAQPDFETAAKKDIVTQAMDPKAARVLSSAKGRLLTVRPQKLEGKEAVLLRCVYLGHPDGTMQYLAFYLNPEAAKEPDKWDTLTESIASSLLPGDTKLSLDGGVRSLSDGLSIQLPKDHRLTAQQGPDFDVYRVHRMAPLGESLGSLGIYLGGHPRLHHEKEGLAAQKIPGKLMQKSIEWHKSVSKLVSMETLLPIDDRTVAHIFFNAPVDKPALIEEWKKIADSLSKTPAKKP